MDRPRNEGTNVPARPLQSAPLTASPIDEHAAFSMIQMKKPNVRRERRLEASEACWKTSARRQG
jgi:hypothetical protein